VYFNIEILPSTNGVMVYSHMIVYHSPIQYDGSEFTLRLNLKPSQGVWLLTVEAIAVRCVA